MNPKHKKITNLFFQDITTLLIALPVGLIFIFFAVACCNSLEYALKWCWIAVLAFAFFAVLICTTQKFKLWRLSRKDLKEGNIATKEIVIDTVRFESSVDNARHRTMHNILDDLLADALEAVFRTILKSSGGEDRYLLTDTENNTYYLTNFYKTKTRKKDFKKPLAYSTLNGRTIEVEYLEASKLILSIKMDKNTKNSKLIGGFWEVFGGYMI